MVLAVLEFYAELGDGAVKKLPLRSTAVILHGGSSNCVAAAGNSMWYLGLGAGRRVG